MSAFLQSGRSDQQKLGEIKVRFRPRADIGSRPLWSTQPQFRKSNTSAEDHPFASDFEYFHHFIVAISRQFAFIRLIKSRQVIN